MAAVGDSDVSTRIPMTSENNRAASLSESMPMLRISSVLNKLQHLIDNMPDSVPEAGDNDKLAIFGRNPKDFDDERLDPDGLWKEVLNPLLKSHLGWGTEENMDNIV